jgi:DNA (cytosine-5)-methyltransferase 1
MIAHALRGEGFDASEDGTERGVPLMPAVGFNWSAAAAQVEALRTKEPAVAFESRFARNGRGAPSEVVPPLKAQSGETGKGDAAPLVHYSMQVRRLTPRECERLQGFPDDYTLISYRGKPAADGPRYKALGNSMAMRWLGQRIQMVNQVRSDE